VYILSLFSCNIVSKCVNSNNELRPSIPFGEATHLLYVYFQNSLSNYFTNSNNTKIIEYFSKIKRFIQKFKNISDILSCSHLTSKQKLNNFSSETGDLAS